MSLQTRLDALITDIGADVKSLQTQIDTGGGGVYVSTTAPVGVPVPYLWFHDLGDGTYDVILEVP